MERIPQPEKQSPRSAPPALIRGHGVFQSDTATKAVQRPGPSLPKAVSCLSWARIPQAPSSCHRIAESLFKSRARPSRHDAHPMGKEPPPPDEGAGLGHPRSPPEAISKRRGRISLSPGVRREVGGYHGKVSGAALGDQDQPKIGPSSPGGHRPHLQEGAAAVDSLFPRRGCSSWPQAPPKRTLPPTGGITTFCPLCGWGPGREPGLEAERLVGPDGAGRRWSPRSARSSKQREPPDENRPFPPAPWFTSLGPQGMAKWVIRPGGNYLV